MTLTQRAGHQFTAFRRLGLALAASTAILASSAAGAQEITQRFLNPSFGGNPFYSDHLLGTAQFDRPAAPPVDFTRGMSEQQLLIRQIQSRLLSALSSGLIEAVTGAEPGSSGEFVIGDQRITYERTLTEIILTFFNETTGETTEIRLPVINADGFASGMGGPPLSTTGSMAGLSPESLLNGSTTAGSNGIVAGADGLIAGGSPAPLTGGGSVEYSGPLEPSGSLNP